MVGLTEGAGLTSGAGLTEGAGLTSGAGLISGADSELYLPGVSGNYASTTRYIPASGVFRVEVFFLVDDYTPASNQTLCGVFDPSGNNRCWWMYIRPSGTLRFVVSDDGGTTSAAESTVGVPDQTRYVAAEFDLDSNTVDVETSSDGSSWAGLGTQITGFSVVPYASSIADLEIGSFGGGTSGLYAGVIGYVRLLQDGSEERMIDFRAQAPGTTSFTASGETVTVNSSGGDPAAIQQVT